MRCIDNKENEMSKENKRALIIDERGRVEKSEVQGKRARTIDDQNEKHNVQVVVASLEWPQMIQ